MNGNFFCHICGGLVDLIKLQPSGVRFCECNKRFDQLRAENEKLKSQISDLESSPLSEEALDILRSENTKLKAELRSIDGALDDLRTNLTLTTAEVIWELKAELAEAKKDAELWREREAKIKSLKERGFLKSPLRDDPYKVVMKGK